MTPGAVAQRRCVLFTMLTTLGCHFAARPGATGDHWDPLVPRRLGGIGRIEAGMARQGFDLELRRYDVQGWRETFYPEGRIHSATVSVGTAWTRDPWTAVQRATWEALRRREAEGPATELARPRL